MNIHRIYFPFNKFFRKKRMQKFKDSFEIDNKTLVLDVGGFPFNWSLIGGSHRVVILNLKAAKERNCDVAWIVANGLNLPFKNSAFNIVYSNSVIEHLGTFDNQCQFAKEIARVGRKYYVQTPNKWFPIEPHYITPIIHWLPCKIQRRLLRNFTVWGLLTRPSLNKCDDLLKEIRLLDEKEMQNLFPEAEIWKERFLGFIKSLVVMKK